jgi:peptidyl-prolyl cis-trans isomerase D
VAAISDLHDAIEDERAGGARLAEVAAKYDLAMVALPAVDAAGNGTSGDELAGLPDGLVAAAYESDVGLENNPIQPSSDTFVWYEVTGITQPRERDLAEVREQALAAWKDDQRQKRLEAAAAQFRDAVERGNPFVDVAASSGSLEVRTREGLTRGTRPEGDLSTAAILAAFSNPKGAVAVAPGADDMARAVMLIEDVATPPFVPGGTDLAADRQQATQQYVGDLLGLYVAQVQNNTDMRFNQIALQQALGIAPN